MQAYLCARLGDGTKVVDHVCLRHAHTGVAYNEHFVLLIRDDSDVKLLLGLEGSRVCQRRITNFIERVRSVRDQSTKENLLVGVESVGASSASSSSTSYNTVSHKATHCKT